MMRPPSSDLAIFIFSYNRGFFLENCLKSIVDLWPSSPRFIIDDCSDDAMTRGVLSRYLPQFSLLSRETAETEFKTGGLYGNMNAAIQISSQMGFERVLFIQDDMQLVRPLTDEDRDRVSNYFANVPDAIQLVTTFVRSSDAQGYAARHTLNGEASAYFRNREYEGGKSNFSAVGIFEVQRVVQRFGRFEAGEGKNSEKARSLGIRCGRAMYPFMNWTPYPSSFRGKRRSLSHRLVEFLGGSGVHPIEYMTDETVERFLSRDPEVIPVMEEWLHSPSAPRQDRWSTGGGEYNLTARFEMASKIWSLRRERRSYSRSSLPANRRHYRNMNVNIKDSIPPRIRRSLGFAKTVGRRLRIWRDVGMQLSGATRADQSILRRALLQAPIDIFRETDRWRDPMVAADCRLKSRGIGTFHIRAHSDDLWHALPTREMAVIGTIRKLLAAGDVFVDAGANIGIYSVLASRLVGPQGRVIAIEMMPDTAVILKGHLIENGCDNTTLVEAALSHRSRGKISAHVSDGKFGQASIATGVGDRAVQVETTTLAETLSGLDHIRLIKMDLEGAELGALQGAEAVLDRIDAILFEDWGDARIGAHLTERGFKIERLDGKNSLATRP